jgi:hypothetical protein
MRKVVMIAAVTGLAVWLGGCSSGGDEVAQAPDAAEQAAPTESPAAEGSPQPSAAQQPAAQQPAANRQRPRGITPSDLIGSTNPDQRLRSIQSQRPDPFALVPTSPSVTITRPEIQPGAGSGSAPATSRPANRPAAPRVAVVPPAIPDVPEFPRLPRSLPTALAPQPEIARAVGVSGVVQIGGIVYAIVDAPDEPSSRYVQVGQRLSNGEVLVRRIDFDGPDSAVVLEQAGMQVVRRVGDAPIVPTAPGAAPAAQPATPPSA